MSRVRNIGAGLITRLILLIFIVVAAFPIYWMFNTSLASDSELFGTGQEFFPNLGRLNQIPGNLAEVNIWGLLANSAFIATGVTVLSFIFAIMAAYALSRFKFHGRGIAGFLLFSTQMMPEALLVVPLFALFATFGLLNDLVGLVLINTAFTMPVAVFIMKTAIDKIPYEIEESAKVDGCSSFGQLGMIVMPLILPSVAAAAVINFFEGWNEFLFANSFIRDQALWPASVGLAQFMGQYSTPLSTVMAAALVFTLPAIAFFLLAQRQIISGLTTGAVKG
jgi:multiple sugar transport system permease protein